MSITSLDRKLLARLQRVNVLNEEQAESLIARAEAQQTPLADLVVAEGIADDKTVARQMARLCGLEFLDLEKHHPNPAIMSRLTPEQAWHCRAVPIAETEEFLVVGVDDASNVQLLDELRLLTGADIRIILITRAALDAALDEFYPVAIDAPDVGHTSYEETRSDSSSEVPLDLMATKLDDPMTISPGMDTLGGDNLSIHPTRIISLPTMAGDEEEQDESHLMAQRSDDYMKRTGSTAEDLLLSSGFIPKLDMEQPSDEELSADRMLREMIDTALLNRAEELEFAPQSSKRSRTRIRKDGYWLDATPYPIKYHGALLARLKKLAGVDPYKRQPVECHLTLRGKRGHIPAIASFTPTLRGDRCILRFPENLPLLQNPLRVLGLPEELAEELGDRLDGCGGGLLLLTSHKTRLAHQLYSSFLLEHSGEDKMVVSLDWTLERRLPHVHQIDCPDEHNLRAALDQVTREEPDLLGIQTVPTASLLQQVFTIALRGQSVLACFTVARPEHALEAFRSSGVDPTALGFGLMAHTHVTRVPRLCPTCREPLEKKPRRVPPWAEEIAAQRFFEAQGCPACAGTGRRGINWVCEVWVPKTGTESSVEQVRFREDILREYVEAGEIDVRDVR